MPRTHRVSFPKAIISASLAAAASLAFAAEPPIQQGTPHPFVCSDYSAGKVFIVSAKGKAEWEYPAPKCNDLWILPNGNLLFLQSKTQRVAALRHHVTSRSYDNSLS